MASFLHIEELIKICSQITMSTYVFSVAPFQKMGSSFTACFPNHLNFIQTDTKKVFMNTWKEKRSFRFKSFKVLFSVHSGPPAFKVFC